MSQTIEQLTNIDNHNYILPFLWMRGEEEDIIRNEIAKIYECGIRAICVEARPHPDFAGPGWWHDLDIVMDEARQRGMSVWVLDDAHFPTGYASGLLQAKYPERKKKYINYNIADVWGAKHEMTLHIKPMLKPRSSWLDLDKPKDVMEQSNNTLISVVAAPLITEGIISEQLIELTDQVQGEFITCQLPEGQWRIFVIYETKTDGGNPTYINMIDELSARTQLEAVYEPHYARYKDDFGQTFAGFFSDEPSFGNVAGFAFDETIGKKDMPLPWSEEAKELLIAEYGERWSIMLPYLWATSNERKQCIHTRYTYMNIVTKLYEKNFSRQLGDWCEAHGVEYIGHVIEDNNQHSRLGSGAGHYFRAMAGQHMAGIDVIGGQVIAGGAGLERVGIAKGDGEFYHYALGKLGSSAGHLDPKKQGRTMCELFGAYGWKLGVRDMKYITDHLISRGINYLVPHAFSMREYPDYDCPPHFYARGNNPQFKHFAKLMQYANRLCHLFNGGTHIAPVAILYHGESEWTGEYMKMQKPARVLAEHQIDFDFVPIDMLKQLDNYNGKVEQELLTINGEQFSCLVLPYSQYITKELAAFIRDAVDLDIIFIDAAPEGISNELNEALSDELLVAARLRKVVAIDKLADYLIEKGHYDIRLTSEFKHLTYYHYKKNQHLYMLQNESSYEVFRGQIELPTGEHEQAIIYDAFEQTFERLKVTKIDKVNYIELELHPYQSCVIIPCTEQQASSYPYYMPLTDKLAGCRKQFDLSSNWTYALTDNASYPKFSESNLMEQLVPISRLHPMFTGIIRYEKTFEYDQTSDQQWLVFDAIYEAVELWVNEQYVGMKIATPYIFELSGFLKLGTNQLRIEIATTLDRDRLQQPEPPFQLTHEPMEPTGMFGNVILMKN